MLYKISVLFLIISLAVCALAEPQQKTPPAQPQSQAREQAGFIAPSAVNVHIESDVRTLIMMAAINVAGFDYETAGLPLTPARAALRKELTKVDPALKAKLAEFYKSHWPSGVEEQAYAARYAALSLMMTPPPGFTVYQPAGIPIPDDLLQLKDFADLLREFYLKSGIKDLLPLYTAVSDRYAKEYYRPAGETVYSVLEYFHTKPETVINMRPLVIKSEDPNRHRTKEQLVSRNRTRQVFVIPDPFAALDTATVRGDFLNQKDDQLARRVGDDYIVIIGPSKSANMDAVRQALVRFVIDPMVERHLKFALDYKDDIVKLVAGVPTAAKQYASSVYLVIRESLAQAAEARLKRIRSIASRGSYTEDDAVYDLAQAYLKGSVLAFHFYESLKGYEQVGINIEDFFDQMIATTKFDREANRSKEFEPVVAKVAATRSTKKSASPETQPALPSAGSLATKILLSDDLIRERRFMEARMVLEEILGADPKNARALYGMARVINQLQSKVESDPGADENDKIQAQHDRLKQAIDYYQKAINSASRESELWLIQWSHVYLGRIYDFQEFRQDAIAEYEKAIALGQNIPNGAYKEALEGKARPFGQQ